MTLHRYFEENRLVLELLGSHPQGDWMSPDALVSVYRSTLGDYSCFLVRGYFRVKQADDGTETRVYATDALFGHEDNACKKAVEMFELLVAKREAIQESLASNGSVS